MDFLPLLIFLPVLAWVLFVFFTKRGRGIMFGGTILKTWDGVAGKCKIVSSRVKVHAVDAAPGHRLVGLEISNYALLSYQMIPISLPASEARELARLLVEAADFSASNNTQA